VAAPSLDSFEKRNLGVSPLGVELVNFGRGRTAREAKSRGIFAFSLVVGTVVAARAFWRQ